MTLTLELRRQPQEDICEFKINPICTVNSKTELLLLRLCLRINKRETETESREEEEEEKKRRKGGRERGERQSYRMISRARETRAIP